MQGLSASRRCTQNDNSGYLTREGSRRLWRFQKRDPSRPYSWSSYQDRHNSQERQERDLHALLFAQTPAFETELDISR